MNLAERLMSSITRAASYFVGSPKNRMPNLRDPALNSFFGIPSSTAGVAVSEDTALT